MTINIAHIYACKAKFNSGDFMIGKAYKKYFIHKYLNGNEDVKFTNLDCRNKELYNNQNINKLNNYDYILIGGGGLILPDSAPNKISCWQWLISQENILKITKPIYVLSIGYNLFFNQNLNMPNRDNLKEDISRINIFKSNITTLINISKVFTLRHNEDVKCLLNIIGEEYKNKISYEKCATVWYVQTYWTLNKNKMKYIAIEVKDDRQFRRYHKIGKNKYYNELIKVINYCNSKNKPIVYLSHDGSKDFYNYLKKKKINIPYLDNSCGDAVKIKHNYQQIHTIICNAGHSQMISNGCGIRIISSVTHPKILNYCNDIDNKEYFEPNKDFNFSDKVIKLIQ